MAAQRIGRIPAAFVVVLSLVNGFVFSAVDRLGTWPAALPEGLLALDIVDKIHVDPDTTTRFATDYGGLSQAAPAAVLSPSSPDDIATLVRFAYSSSPSSFSIAAHGHGHSIRGQALVPGGVVVDMASLGRGRSDRINVSSSDWYVDAGGEQLWIDVLRETLKHGLSPRSWTDYLFLTVGGTLSNAGISGQAFRHGPQISNNSDLFYGVLGGLGQFGIITRARIALEPAPRRVRWLRLFYTDFSSFTGDQELLVSMTEKVFDYVEGQLLTEKDVGNSSFFSDNDREKIKMLAAEYGGIYFVEGGVYYEPATASMVDQVDASSSLLSHPTKHVGTRRFLPLYCDRSPFLVGGFLMLSLSSFSCWQKLETLLRRLSFVPGFAFTKDVAYISFLNRVHEEETHSVAPEDVLHPWLNMFVPKSRIRDFEMGVFKGILKNNNPIGLVLIYPFNKNKYEEP
ncbi:hypothetical protein BHE74_00013536 [Ensete ventricosum]|nr:hypothetical protein BHE74_00013536 [Ensete ventricosum]